MPSANDDLERWQAMGLAYAKEFNEMKKEFTYYCSCGKCIVVPAKLDQELLVCPYCMLRLNPPPPPVIPSKEFP